MLIVASLLSILFLTFHLTDDIVRGMEKGGASNLVAVPILVVWLYTNPTRRISNETQRHVNRRVSALDPLPDVSPDGRHRPRDGKGRGLKPRCCTHPGRLAVRNARA